MMRGSIFEREISDFDLNRLAADSLGAAQCICVNKYHDGMIHIAFLTLWRMAKKS
jgi:hypothetical protein